MISGAFKRMAIIILLKQTKLVPPCRTILFCCTSGILGRIAELTFLVQYMKHFLEERNLLIKEVAESAEWKKFLPENISR